MLGKSKKCWENLKVFEKKHNMLEKPESVGKYKKTYGRISKNVGKDLQMLGNI